MVPPEVQPVMGGSGASTANPSIILVNPAAIQPVPTAPLPQAQAQQPPLATSPNTQNQITTTTSSQNITVMSPAQHPVQQGLPVYVQQGNVQGNLLNVPTVSQQVPSVVSTVPPVSGQSITGSVLQAALNSVFTPSNI